MSRPMLTVSAFRSVVWVMAPAIGVAVASCNHRVFNAETETETSVYRAKAKESKETQAPDVCAGFQQQLKDRQLEVQNVYTCSTPNTCVVTWKDRDKVEIGAFLDGSQELYVQWEWRPYASTQGWNAKEDVRFKTEGWELTDQRHVCAGIVNYAFVDILEDESLVVKATRETNRSAICPFRKVFEESLVTCNKKQGE